MHRFLILMLLAFGCTGNGSTSETAEEMTTEVPESPDDEAVAKISERLVSDHLAQDLNYLDEKDRNFQLVTIDLNGDGEHEFFVRFMSSWFCGSGGCTFFLLSANGDMITKFTVTNPPVAVSPEKKNGWSVLYVRDKGEWKELVYENGSYPSNPTTLPPVAYNATDSNARIIFDDENYPSPTYSF